MQTAGWWAGKRCTICIGFRVRKTGRKTLYLQVMQIRTGWAAFWRCCCRQADMPCMTALRQQMQNGAHRMLVYISCKYGTFHICWAITVYRSQSNQYLMNSNQPCSRHEDSFKSAPRLWMSFGACFKAGYKRVWQCVLSRFCMMRRQPPGESKAT